MDMKYTVIEGDSLFDLVHRVGELIRDGWVPVGGVCTIHLEKIDNQFFYQAMVKDLSIEIK